jgi:hypothetical protein
MRSNGFGISLTPYEVLFLRAFDHHYELNFPEEALKEFLSHKETRKVLKKLRKKQLIKGKHPLKLTTAGKDIKENLVSDGTER